MTAFLTAIYSFRLLYMIFFIPTNLLRFTVLNLHESPFLLALPLIILTFGSILFGFYFRDLLIGSSNLFLTTNIVIFCKSIYLIDSEFLHIFIKLVPLFMGIFGFIFLSFGLYF
jgi:NADH:ubiquinone oxidoreductase subunit 5 (subunit L)/multisubunit Na+/H+ antiporter MnhA subunit